MLKVYRSGEVYFIAVENWNERLDLLGFLLVDHHEFPILLKSRFGLAIPQWLVF